MTSPDFAPLPRLSADKLEGITLSITRYLRQLEEDYRVPEKTLLGWDFVEVELVGVTPCLVGAVPAVEL